MKIIPVIDVMNGQSVAAKRGLRSTYRPLISNLCPNAHEPLELAEAYQKKLGLDTVYLADLDGILHNQPNWTLIRSIQESGVKICLDLGCKSGAMARKVYESGVQTIILGLESLDGIEHLNSIIMDSHLQQSRFLLSIDMKDGKLILGQEHQWPVNLSVVSLAEMAKELGINRFLLLDLDRVGTGRGAGTEPMVLEIKSVMPQSEIYVGGGIRDIQDLVQLSALPISGVLIGTALYSETIGPSHLANLLQ